MMILQAQGNPVTFNLLFLVAIIAVMYFFFMRPQIKKQKEQDTFSKNLKSGEKVVTTSGIIARISKINADHIIIITDNKTHLTVLPSAISKELTDNYNKAANS